MNILSSFDVNAAYQPIAERLSQIDGVKEVKGAMDLAQILNGKTTGTDGFVYLIFDRASPKDQAVTNKNQLITVTYSVIVVSQTYQRHGIPEGVGLRIGAVMQALCGFAPLEKDPRARQMLSFVEAGQAAHAYGLSLYPLKFNLDLLFKHSG